MPATTVFLRSIYILSCLIVLGLCTSVKPVDFSRGPDDWVVESITSEFHLQDESCAVFVNQTYDINFPRAWATKISIPLPRLEHTSDMSSKNIQNFKVVSSFNLQKHYVEEPADEDSKKLYFAILQIEFEPVGGRQRLFVEYIIKESVRREKYSSLRVSEQIFGDDAVTKNVFEWSFKIIGAEVEYIKAKFLLPAQWKLAEDHIEVEPKSLISYKSSSLVELVQKSTLKPDTSLYMRIAFDSKLGNCKQIVEKSWLDTLYKILAIIGGVVGLFCCCACLTGICITVRRLTHHNTEKVHLIIPPPIQRSEAAGQYSSIYEDPHQPSAPPSYHYPSATI